MPQSKEVHREYMRKRREGSQNGSQDGGSQVEGSQDVTPEDRISFIQSQLGGWVVKGIEGVARIFNDRESRYEKAYRYHLWKLEH